MKKSSVFTLFISIILAALLILPAVSAYISVPAPAPGLLQPGIISGILASGSLLDKAFLFLFGSSYADTGPAFIVWFAVWLIIFIFTSDTLATFSALSKPAAWAIGAGMGVIFSATGFTSTICVWALGLTSMLGAFSFIVVAITAFAATIIVHLGLFGRLGKWVMNRQIMIKQAKSMMATKEGAGEVEAAVAALKEVAKEFKRK